MMNFQKTDQPIYSPGICRNCGGNQDREWWLDLNYQEEFYGHVYFCNYCFEQMAKRVDYVSNSEINQIIKGYEAKLEEARSHEIYGRIYNRLFGPGINPDDLLQFLDDTDSASLLGQVVKGLPGGKKLAPEPANEPGPIDVPNPPASKPKPKFDLGLSFDRSE